MLHFIPTICLIGVTKYQLGEMKVKYAKSIHLNHQGPAGLELICPHKIS